MNNAEEGFGHLDKIREVLFSARTRELVPMYLDYDRVELAACCCCCDGFILDPLSITIWNGRFSLLFFWQCYGWKLIRFKFVRQGRYVGGLGGRRRARLLIIYIYIYLYLKICALQNFGACTIVVSEGRYWLVSSSLSSSFPTPLITSANHCKGHQRSGLLN